MASLPKGPACERIEMPPLNYSDAGLSGISGALPAARAASGSLSEKRGGAASSGILGAGKVLGLPPYRILFFLKYLA